MYYFPSTCANMNSSACLEVQNHEQRFPYQDDRDKFFILEQFQNSQKQENQLSGGASQARNKRSLEEDEEDYYQSDENLMDTDEEFNDESRAVKKFKSLSNLNSGNSNNHPSNCPTFQHPDGGLISFTPNGNIRTYYDDAKGMEISLLDNNTSFLNFNR